MERPHVGETVRYVGSEHPSMRGRDFMVVTVQLAEKWVRLHPRSGSVVALQPREPFGPWPGPNVPWKDIDPA